MPLNDLIQTVGNINQQASSEFGKTLSEVSSAYSQIKEVQNRKQALALELQKNQMGFLDKADSAYKNAVEVASNGGTNKQIKPFLDTQNRMRQMGGLPAWDDATVEAYATGLQGDPDWFKKAAQVKALSTQMPENATNETFNKQLASFVKDLDENPHLAYHTRRNEVDDLLKVGITAKGRVLQQGAKIEQNPYQDLAKTFQDNNDRMSKSGFSMEKLNPFYGAASALFNMNPAQLGTLPADQRSKLTNAVLSGQSLASAAERIKGNIDQIRKITNLPVEDQSKLKSYADSAQDGSMTPKEFTNYVKYTNDLATKAETLVSLDKQKEDVQKEVTRISDQTPGLAAQRSRIMGMVANAKDKKQLDSAKSELGQLATSSAILKQDITYTDKARQYQEHLMNDVDKMSSDAGTAEKNIAKVEAALKSGNLQRIQAVVPVMARLNGEKGKLSIQEELMQTPISALEGIGQKWSSWVEGNVFANKLSPQEIAGARQTVADSKDTLKKWQQGLLDDKAKSVLDKSTSDPVFKKIADPSSPLARKLVNTAIDHGAMTESIWKFMNQGDKARYLYKTQGLKNLKPNELKSAIKAIDDKFKGNP